MRHIIQPIDVRVADILHEKIFQDHVENVDLDMLNIYIFLFGYVTLSSTLI